MSHTPRDLDQLLRSIIKESVSTAFSTDLSNADDEEQRQHDLARKISNVFSSNHNEIIIEKNYDFYKILDEVTDYYDEPYAYTTMIPYYIISKEASKKNKVVLAGDGGDEAFAGYKWYSQIFNYQKNLNFKTKLVELTFIYSELLRNNNDLYSSFHIDEPAFVMDTTAEEIEMINRTYTELAKVSNNINIFTYVIDKL